jgi:23S rRNA (uracil1939-C5)-methyltransferase
MIIPRMKIKAQSPVYGGLVLSRSESGVFFISGAVPGELVETGAVRKRGDYWTAPVKKVIRPSPDRVDPPCPVFGKCGGCHYQFIAYPRQVAMKEEVIRDSLKRIAKTDAALDAPLAGEPWSYRMRAQLKVGSSGAIGFFGAGSHDIVELEKCLLLAPTLNELAERIRSAGAPGGVRELHIQAGEAGADGPIVHVIGLRCDRMAVRAALEKAKTAGVSFEGEPIENRPRIRFDLDGLEYLVSAGSFFQANWKLNTRLVKAVMDHIEKTKPRRVIDLYSGAGNVSLPAARLAGEITAVEESRLACLDGEHNARLNHLDNVRFIHGRVEALDLPPDTDLVILDPPRGGMTRPVLEKVTRAPAEWMIYVSCNPSTFARDVGRLKKLYAPRSIRLVDMFPQTCHIEILGILQRTG